MVRNSRAASDLGSVHAFNRPIPVHWCGKPRSVKNIPIAWVTEICITFPFCCFVVRNFANYFTSAQIWQCLLSCSFLLQLLRSWVSQNIMCFSKENASAILLKACSVKYVSTREDAWTTQVENVKKKPLTKWEGTLPEFQLVAWMVGPGQQGILCPVGRVCPRARVRWCLPVCYRREQSTLLPCGVARSVRYVEGWCLLHQVYSRGSLMLRNSAQTWSQEILQPEAYCYMSLCQVAALCRNWSTPASRTDCVF